MKTINLLPKEIKVRDVRGVVLNVILILMVVLAVIMGVFSFIIFDVEKDIGPRLEEYRKVNMQVDGYISKLETYEEFEKKVIEKSELVNSLQGDEIFWSDVLNTLGEKIPKNVYINYVDGDSTELYEFIEKGLEDEEEIKKIKFFSVGGCAANYNDISRFAIDIRDIPNVGEVFINSISKDTVTESNIEVVSFNITAYYDLQPYLEKMKSAETVQVEEGGEEDTLDMEIEMME
jgi:hypothetical protein